MRALQKKRMSECEATKRISLADWHEEVRLEVSAVLRQVKVMRTGRGDQAAIKHRSTSEFCWPIAHSKCSRVWPTNRTSFSTSKLSFRNDGRSPRLMARHTSRTAHISHRTHLAPPSESPRPLVCPCCEADARWRPRSKGSRSYTPCLQQTGPHTPHGKGERRPLSGFAMPEGSTEGLVVADRMSACNESRAACLFEG